MEVSRISHKMISERTPSLRAPRKGSSMIKPISCAVKLYIVSSVKRNATHLDTKQGPADERECDGSKKDAECRCDYEGQR